MNPLKSLSYEDLIAEQQTLSTSDGLIHQVHQHPTWGTLELKSIQTESIDINYYTGHFNEELSINFIDKKLPNVVNVCISLEGHTAAYSKNHHWLLPLSANRYHHVFLNDDAYDLHVAKKFQDVHIQFDTAYFKDLLCDENPWMQQLKESLDKDEMILQGDASLTYEMTQILQGLFNNPLSGQLKKIYTEAKVLELLATQMKQLSDLSVNTKCNSSDRDLFHAIQDFLAQNFSKDLSLAMIAKVFGINEFKLKKGYKQYFNCTVFDSILEFRMKRAYHLLQQGDFLVHEISHEIGYKSPNHFATAFKRRFGKSPSAL